jgi:hypothetical protein
MRVQRPERAALEKALAQPLEPAQQPQAQAPVGATRRAPGQPVALVRVSPAQPPSGSP